MEKYLFNNGQGFQHVESAEELEKLVKTYNPADISIWVYGSNEWISYDAYSKARPQFNYGSTSIKKEQSLKKASRAGKLLRKAVVLAAALSSILLVFNFTKIKWVEAGLVTVHAARPVNMPEMDIDSLYSAIEAQRSQKLDRSTKTNLRLRNSWPGHILLAASSMKETAGNNETRFSDLKITLDNTTGFALDQATVQYIIWKNQKVQQLDTIVFTKLAYGQATSRSLPGQLRGDSLSISFQSIRSRDFNFCYSADRKNEPGSHHDRWFCKE